MPLDSGNDEDPSHELASTQMLDAVDCVLFVPENIDGAMEVQVTLERLDPDGVLGALTDRWRIYHGDPEEGAWAIADIDAARHDGSVYDGLAMQRENSLADREPGLCRMVNTTHRDGLRALCERLAGVDATAPLLVGVDPCGLDVRRRFDIVRLPIEPPIENAETAEERLLALLGGEGPDT